ncbi:MAG: hypothetical protein ACRC1D_03480 [Culicoidibacterales bacterium]
MQIVNIYMIVVFVSEKQIKRILPVDAPKCKCGFDFEIAKFTKEKDGKILGITATCGNKNCENSNNPLIGENESDLLCILNKQ